MTLALLTCANALAITNGSEAPSSVDWTSWAQLALLMLAILGAAAIIRHRPPSPEGISRKKFAKFLRLEVIRHTEALKVVLGSKLQDNPADFTAAQSYLRGLRKDLRGAISFIARMDRLALDQWPELDLYETFHDWAEPIGGMDRMLDDMLRDLDIASRKALIGPLLEQYRADAWRVRLDLSDLDARSNKLVKAAEAIEK